MKKDLTIGIIIIVLLAIILGFYFWPSGEDNVNNYNDIIDDSDKTIKIYEEYINKDIKIISFSEVPVDAKNYLLGFLSKDYIEEHFRFYGLEEKSYQKKINFFLVYGDEIIPSLNRSISTPYGFDEFSLEWDVQILNGGKRYFGLPLSNFEVNLLRNDAEKTMGEANCDISNLYLTPYEENIVFNASNGIYWICGGQVDPEICYKDVCLLNAETGKLVINKGGCSLPT